jgi:5-dehydro-4-deoxyglucarate dehydratase
MRGEVLDQSGVSRSTSQRRSATIDPQELKARISSGLLSFPVTYFEPNGDYAPEPYRKSVAKAAANGAAILFAAGGTGEFFSIAPDEYPRIVADAVAGAGKTVPIVAGCGYGTRMAVQFARSAEASGAAGILLLPHYLIQAEQAGLYAHVKAVCDAVRIGVIVYNRDNSVLTAETVARLAESCPNLIGFKDGYGDIELVLKITTLIGDRLAYIGGMPTHEVFAAPYFAAGVKSYSSAVYNFIPKAALRFHAAIVQGDTRASGEMLRRFFYPYLAIRNRGRGYAVSIVKAGMRVMGEEPGPVRSPLTDLNPQEHRDLEKLLHDAFDGKPG